jgi:hypothetical protein
MLTVLFIFMAALPVLAANAPANSSDLEIRRMLKSLAKAEASPDRLAKRDTQGNSA